MNGCRARLATLGLWLVAAAVVQASSAAVPQKEDGFLAAPMPRRVGGAVVEGCPGGVVEGTLQWAVAESTVHEFNVDPATWGRPFRLTVEQLASNVDITFETATEDRSFATLAFGGERGNVPSGASMATVCLAAGSPTFFHYTAG